MEIKRRMAPEISRAIRKKKRATQNQKSRKRDRLYGGAIQWCLEKPFTDVDRIPRKQRVGDLDASRHDFAVYVAGNVNIRLTGAR